MFEKLKAKIRNAVVEDTAKKMLPYADQLEKYDYPTEANVMRQELNKILSNIK